MAYSAVEESAVSLSSETTKSFEVGFGIETTFSGKIPFVGEAGLSVSFDASTSTSFSGGRTDETAVTKEVTREVQVTVPSNTITTLQVTQFQEKIADIDYTASHTVVFIDGSHSTTTIAGTMDGVAVSNVFIQTSEVSI